MRSVEIIQLTETLSLSRTVRGLPIEMRPREWSRNLLVFTGSIVSRSLTGAHNIRICVLVFAVFCASSSGVCLFNDLCDIEEDREHPIKRNRPLAAGALNVNPARFVMILLFAAAVLTCGLYTRADETVARIGSRAMPATIPFVVYGIFRDRRF